MWSAYCSLPSYPSPILGSRKVISDDVTEMGWGTVMHEARVSSNIQRNTANNSAEVL
jgi:hypothetical protein